MAVSAIILQKSGDFVNCYKKRGSFIDKLKDKEETDKILKKSIVPLLAYGNHCKIT
jgi:hypothetical protein